MSVQDYMSALKLGKKEYHACVNKGAYPYLPVLENLVSDDEIDSEVSLSVDQIPLRLVVGTCNASRTNAFAGNFMPLLDWGTEFSAKWASLSDSQVSSFITISISDYYFSNVFTYSSLISALDDILPAAILSRTSSIFLCSGSGCDSFSATASCKLSSAASSFFSNI